MSPLLDSPSLREMHSVPAGRGSPASAAPLFANRRTALIALACITVFGLALRCYHISSRSLWIDEAFTYRISQFPLPELLDRVAQDNSPPLHFLLLKLWTFALGGSPLALRSLSVFFGVATILGVYLFTVEAFRCRTRSDDGPLPVSAGSRGIALWAAGLVAVSLFQIRWAWDVRMYTLATALAVFSSWALCRALNAQSRRWLPWLGYAALALLFAYTHYFALFTLVAQALFAGCYLLVQARGSLGNLVRSPRFHRALVAGALIGVGWLPWVPCFLAQRSHVQADFWVREFSLTLVRENAYQMVIEPECRTIPSDPVTFLLTAACAALCFGAPLALFWKPRAVKWQVAAAALLPVGLSVLVTKFGGTRVFYSRYLLFAHLFILISLALLIGQVHSRWARRTVGGLLLLFSLVLDLRFIEKVDLPSNPGASAVAAYVEGRREPDEPVVVCSPLLYLPLRYHLGDVPGWVQYGGQPVHWHGWSAIRSEEVMSHDRLRAFQGQRLWVVDLVGNNQYRISVPVPADWVARRRVRFRDTYGLHVEIVVVEYERMNTALASSAANLPAGE